MNVDKEEFDELNLPPGVRNRLAELRACDNIMSLTSLGLTDAGLVCILVPNDHYARDANWGLPTEPQLLTIPVARHVN